MDTEFKHKHQANAYHVYKIINLIYPGFLIHRDEKLYLTDTSICEDALTFELRLITSRIYLSGKDFMISVSMDSRLYGGFLRMEYDFDLSDETCIFLYDYNFEILYYVPVSDSDQSRLNIKESVSYDKEAIIRRYTIKNIIK